MVFSLVYVTVVHRSIIVLSAPNYLRLITPARLPLIVLKQN